MKAHLTKLLLATLLFTLAPAAAQAGWYAGAGIGNTDAALDVGLDLPPSTESDDSGLGWGIFGGYEFAPTFALEFGYGDLGDDYETFNLLGNDERIQLDVAEIDVSLVGKVKVHDRVHLFGRVGVAAWDAEVTYEESGFDSSDSDLDMDAVIGAGFEFRVADTVGIRFQWTQFQNVGDEVKTDLPAATGGRLELNGTDISILGVAAAIRIGG